MKDTNVNQKIVVSILAMMLLVFGVQGISYAQTLSASSTQPLTEVSLESVNGVMLILHGGHIYEASEDIVAHHVKVSGIAGVTLRVVRRLSDAGVKIILIFDGTDFDGTGHKLTFTVEAGAIAGYTGSALTAELPVAASDESVVASTTSPLTEATLDGNTVTLTLQDRTYETSRDVSRNLKVSGIAGVTFRTYSVKRISDTEMTAELDFNGADFDGTGHRLTFTLDPEAIRNYKGSALTTELSVAAFDESVTASTASPLTEATLDGSIIALTLHGGRVYESRSDIRLKVSGIAGVTFRTANVKRISDTEMTVKLNFNGNIDTVSTLTFDLERAIADYKGPAVTVELPVSASDESLTASTASPLTEATLDGNTVTLTLQGRTYETSRDVLRHLKVSGIAGVTFRTANVKRISDTETTVELDFDGDVDTASTLTFTVEAGAIAGYTGSALTAELPVSASDESVVASTTSPLTEATLDGSIVTLTLRGGRVYETWSDVSRNLKVSGIAGTSLHYVKRISDTETTVELDFDGDVDTASTLTFTVNAGAIANYEGSALTAELPVSASDESVRASTASPLTEATLDGSIITLTLQGRTYETWSDVSRNLKVSGIAGTTFTSSNVKRISDTEATVELDFNGTDFDGIQNKLTFTVEAGAIANYEGSALTAELPVSASDESVRASAASPLTEVTLDGSIVTLTLHGGRVYETSRNDIARHLKVSGIAGVTQPNSSNVQRVSDTEVTVRLNSDGTDFDGTGHKLTFTVEAGAITNYEGSALTAELPISASDESVAASTSSPLTEATLDGNTVTLTLHSGRIYKTGYISQNLIKVSGIAGVTVNNVSRRSNTEVAVELGFTGNINTAATLTFTVETGAIENYKGSVITAELPVFGGDEYVIASAASPLTEATLDGNIVTLTLHGGRVYETSRNDIARHLKVSGIAGVTQPNSSNVQRVSDTEATVRLNFDGTDFDGTGHKLTFTVEAGTIANYEGSALTAELPVSASDESVAASTTSPLTEATLDGNTVTLTLQDRTYETSRDVSRNLKVSGIAGVTVNNVSRRSNTEVAVELGFTGNINAAATLTFTVETGAIANYEGSALTAELPVFGGDEYVIASAASPLTEATLDGNIVTLTLHGGRVYETSRNDIARHLKVSGIVGATFSSSDVNRVSNTAVTVRLGFTGNINTTATLTFTVEAGGIQNYNGADLTTTVSVSAVAETQPPVVVAETPTNTQQPTLPPTPQPNVPSTPQPNVGTTPTPTPTVSGDPSRITISGSATRSGATVNQHLDAPLLVRVLDDNGNGVADTRVIFRVISGRGKVSELGNGQAIRVHTDQSGTARADLTPLEDGTLTVQATATEISQTVEFTITTGDASTPRTPGTPPAVGTAGSQPGIYWIDSEAGRIQHFDGSNVHDIITGLAFSQDASLDITGDKMYWTALHKIQCANLDGSNVQDLVTGLDTIWGLALDVAGGKIYWTSAKWNAIKGWDPSKIQCANLDGSNVQDLVTGLDTIWGLALDVTGGKMYWTNNKWNATKGKWDPGKIQSANLDGSNVQDLVTGLDVPWSLALDITGGKMYWTALHKIQRANLDGSNVQDITTEINVAEHIALDVTGGKMYWADPSSSNIQYANLDGSNMQDLVTGLAYPTGIALVIPPQTVVSRPTKTTQVHVDAADRPAMYWIDAAAGTLHRLVDAEVENLLPSIRNATSLTLDVANDTLYWAEKTSHTTGRIRSANLDGTNVALVKELTSVPIDIALDATNGTLYLTNAWGKVQRMNLDASGFQPNFITGLDTLTDLAIDVAGGTLYWTEKTSHTTGKIQSANLDGTNVQLLRDLTSVPLDMTLDATDGTLYWTNSRGKVQRMNVDASGFQPNFITGLNKQMHIAVDPTRQQLYLTSSDGKISRRNFSGGGSEEVATGLGNPASLMLADAIPDDQMADDQMADDQMADTTPQSTPPDTMDNAADVNQDGKVDHVDLGIVAAALFGGNPPAILGRLDVNDDKVLNIQDLVLIENNLDEEDAMAAPALGIQRNALAGDKIQAAIDVLLATDDGSLGVRRTLIYLQNLLAMARPDETQLLANYPNPFNPETWIPYQLSTGSDVRITIYDVNGKVIRRLILGYQSAGYYTPRSRAAYWDGRNAQGERVASGLYFYTFTAGDFTATRKMLIRK